MTRRVGLIISLLAVSIVGCSESPQAADRVLGAGLLEGKSPPSPNVTSTIADADTTVAPALQYRSDGLGPYVNSRTLLSQIQGIGDWVLDMYTVSNATRQVFLDFSQPITGTGPNGGNPVSLPSGLYKVRIISNCSLVGNNFLTLAPGATVPCPLHVKFDYSGSSWALEMNPQNAPESNYANVTCVNPASGSGSCVGWKVTPSGTTTEARLIHYVTTKGSTVNVDEGDYDISYSIGVTNP